MDDIFLCARIGVDCVENDPIAIENGEPKYLGFVFAVKREEADDTIKFIEETLKTNNVPYEDVYVYSTISLPLVKIWDKEQIAKTIERDAKYLIQMKESKGKQK